MVASRFEVYLVRLDPTEGSEIRKTRPCVVISPNEMNQHISTIIVAPMTSTHRNYPTRVDVAFRRRKGQIALDQIRTVDKQRLVRRLGSLDSGNARKTLAVLAEMFAP